MGSGAMVDNDHVLTAAHCVYSAQHGGFAKVINVYAGKNGNTWYASTTKLFARVFTAYYQQDNADPFHPHSDYDMGLITLRNAIGNSTGWFGMEVRRPSFLNTAGFPGDKYNGEYMYYTSGSVSAVYANQVAYRIDVMGGQSGSALWRIFNGSRYIEGVV